MSRRRASEPFDAARTEALWARQVESGANTAAFCATEGLDVRTYNRWKGQLMARRSEQRSEQTSPAASPELVDVTTLLAPQSAGAVEVILLDGIRLRIMPDFDPTTLRRVVEALR